MTDNKREELAGFGLMSAITSDIGVAFRILKKVTPELGALGMTSDMEQMEAAVTTIQTIGVRCHATVNQLLAELAK